MEGLLSNISSFLHSDVLLANATAITTALVVIIRAFASIKSKKPVKIEVGNEETNKKLKELEKENKELKEENKKTQDMLLVMVRYSRLSDEAKAKVDEIYEGEKDVDLEAPEEEPIESHEHRRTVIQRLSNELDR